VSRYFSDDGRLSRQRLTNTRLVSTELVGLANKIDDAFNQVQNEIDAGTGGGGPGLLVYDFAASAMWVVNHNLGRAVSVEVLSAGGAKVGAEVLQVTPNQLRVYFEVPVPGRVLVR
jgi:hypothetical protein